MPRSAADEIVWPTGGFQWTPELRAKLPIVRGINAPPLKAPWPLVSSLVELEKALDGQFPGAKSGLSWGETETLARQYALLRHSIACAAQAEYENALAVASKLQSRGIVHKFACTYLFPHIEAWATEYLEAGQQFEALLALNSILPLRKVLATLERYTWVFSNSYYFSQFSSSPIYLQIHLHGEQALDLLDLGVRHGTMTLPLYGRMHSPQTIPRLVPHMEKREAREALEELAKHYPAAVMKTAMEHAAATRSATNDRWTVRLAMAHVDAQPAALAALDEASRTKFQTLLAALDCKEADPAQVPDLLLNPPWRQKVRPPAPPRSIRSQAHHFVFVLQRDHSQQSRDQRIHSADRIVLAHLGQSGEAPAFTNADGRRQTVTRAVAGEHQCLFIRRSCRGVICRGRVRLMMFHRGKLTALDADGTQMRGSLRRPAPLVQAVKRRTFRPLLQAGR